MNGRHKRWPVKAGVIPNRHIPVRVTFDARVYPPVWHVRCGIAKCRLDATAATHNGGHQLAARHRREKSLLLNHGARKVEA